MTLEPHTPNDALAEAVTRCALTGEPWVVINADGEKVWDIAADTKVDDEDLSYPVIVHMRGGTLASDSIAVLIPARSLA